MSDKAERRFFSGQSTEQAIMAAARHYQLNPEELAYRLVEKRHGFLKIRRRVVIEVNPSAPRREPAPPEAATVRQPKPSPPEAPGGAPPARAHAGPRPAAVRESATSRLIPLPESPKPLRDRYPLAEGEAAEAAKKALDLLLKLAGLRLSGSVLQGEERFEIELSGPDQERLLAKNGNLLFAVQHLLPRLIKGLHGEIVPCRVDCDGFQEIREERLRDMAQQAADKVRRQQRPQRLPLMNPADRRIVHLTLAEDPAVVTESEGEGYLKRVRVDPA